MRRIVRSFLLAGLVALSCLAQPYFLRKDILVGQHVTQVVSGDFNGDHLPDVAVVTQEGVFVLLNTGGGILSSPIRTDAPGELFWMAVAADFNGDGKDDLVGSGQLFLSRGDGTFRPPVAIGDQEAVAPADFNGDGKMDLVISDAYWSAEGFVTHGVRVLLGNGDGTFRTGPKISPYGPIALQVADFNRDGRPDVALLGVPDDYPGLIGRGLYTLLVFLNHSDGTFGSPIQTVIPLTSNTWPINKFIVADFNGDKIPDVFGMSGVMLGRGDGSFGAPIPYVPEERGAPITAVDVTGDGHVDMVMTYEDNSLAICPGKGDGTMLAPMEISVSSGFGYPYYSTILVDLDGDGRLDLVTSNGYTNSVSLLMAKAQAGPELRRAVSAASDLAILAPGSLATLYAPSPAETAEARPPWPTTLDGIVLQLQESNGWTWQVPLLYVSPTQINFQVPADTAVGEAKLTIGTHNGPIDGGSAQVNAKAPTLFMLSAGNLVPAASGVLVKPDGTQVPLSVSSCDPYIGCGLEMIPLSTAAGTIYLSFFGTGFGSTTADEVTCSINGMPVPVTYTGLQATPGIDQVNIRLIPELLQVIAVDPLWGAEPAMVTIHASGLPVNSFYLWIQ